MDVGAMRRQLERLREAVRKRKVEFAEMRFATSRSSSLVLQDGRADRMGAGERAGIGVRVVVAGAWGFASSESTDFDDWVSCLDSAVDMAKVSAQRLLEPAVLAETTPVVDEIQASYEIDPIAVPLARKLAAVKGYEESSACRACPAARDRLQHSRHAGVNGVRADHDLALHHRAERQRAPARQ